MFDFFMPVLDFVDKLIKDIQMLIEMVSKMSAFLTSMVSWLPVEMQVTFTVLLAVCLLYKVLGRES